MAEIIVGFALGLDLSTLAAVASGQFATAHEKLGRNRPTHGLKDEHLDREFFAMVLGSRGRVVDWSRWSVSDQVTYMEERQWDEEKRNVVNLYIARLCDDVIILSSCTCVFTYTRKIRTTISSLPRVDINSLNFYSVWNVWKRRPTELFFRNHIRVDKQL